LCITFKNNLIAQSLDLEIGIGKAVYNGDLSHHGPLYSKEEANNSHSFGLSYSFNKSWIIKGQYTRTKLEGSDKYATNQGLINRNLHFWAPINEYSTTLQYHFLPTFDITSNHLSPYITVGMGIFHFKPHALYEGKNYELQPMSTEGQGLPGNTSAPYQLSETNIQIGAGIRIKLTKSLSITLSSILRRLTTDYLDDVSGSYYNINQLAIYNGVTAAKLAYRSGELSNDLPETVDGLARGNPNNNDSYIIHQITFAYSLYTKSKNQEPPQNN
jgi:hypothetical protein